MMEPKWLDRTKRSYNSPPGPEESDSDPRSRKLGGVGGGVLATTHPASHLSVMN